ncbi:MULTISPECIES: hypothetical protein [unclassified Streptomyces]|uniref:hypothetical protein n=1 Tax=unclassified Streptomyces TaxID=2593676 RepID=UPI000962377B|nr:hypothetical protein [Streptomyces sp. TSRI0281]OKI35037.1 hypothetical protein A6A29_16580 [Streptomyces sp. TSRI0281]
MTDINDTAVREILRPHRDGGHISRLYATGEITYATIPALGMLADRLHLDAQDEESDRLDDVIGYVREAGERPPVTGWVAKL